MRYVGDSGNNIHEGSNDDDDAVGLGGNDFIHTWSGDDRIAGGDGDDRLYGDDGRDIVFGGAGNDTIGGAYVVRIDYPDGDVTFEDYVDYDNDADRYSGGDGDDIIFASHDDFVDGGTGIDTLTLVLTGSQQAIRADFSVLTQGGSIVVNSSVIKGIEFLASASLSAFDDRAVAGIAADGVGTTLYGNAGNDRLTGTAALDTLDGGSDDDVLRGEDGSDTLSDYFGDDMLVGGSGDDVLQDTSGRNMMYGGDGDDRITASANGIIDGGTGSDTINLSFEPGNVTVGVAVNFARMTASDSIRVGQAVLSGFEYMGEVTLSEFDDRGVAGTVLPGGSGALNGGGGDDMLFGTDANDDSLRGGTGNDLLRGLGGDDVLNDTSGNDRLIGGAGADTFLYTLFNTARFSGGHNLIADFTRSDGDRIDVSAIDANRIAGRIQQFDFIGDAVFSGRAGELRYEFVGGNTFVYGDTNGDLAADLTIELVGNPPLIAADFGL